MARRQARIVYAKRARAAIVTDEVLETGNRASMTVRLTDGTELTLGSNARLKVDKYVFDQDKSTSKAAIELMQGVFYFISGKLKKRA